MVMAIVAEEGEEPEEVPRLKICVSLTEASLFCAGRFMPGKVWATLSRARTALQRQCAQGAAWKVSIEVDGSLLR